MFSFRGAAVGTWTIESKLDARWNATGKSSFISSLLEMPEECMEKIRELNSRFGAQPGDLVLNIVKERPVKMNLTLSPFYC